jgi:hypothetical protein
MKFLLLILAFPAILLFLLTAAMVRSAQQRYVRHQIERSALLGQYAFASSLWGSLVLLGGALMNGFGLGVKSPLVVLALAVVVGGVFFARLSYGVLWNKSGLVPVARQRGSR